MTNEPGTLAYTEHDGLRITVADEHYLLAAPEVKALLFYGRIVPIIASLNRVNISGDEKPPISIEGHASVNRAGKAVIFYTRAGHYIIPLVSFQRVARGEAISAPLFPLLPDGPEGES
jgi:hypothetical protein